MSKKNKQVILKNNSSVESNEYKKLITIIIIVATIFLIFYVITLFFTKSDKDNIFKNDLNASEIQYDEIIIGEMFNKDGEYYVLLLEGEDPYKSIFDSYVTMIRSGKTKIYTVDLNSAFNRSYKDEENNYEKDNFKVKGTLLLKLDDGNIKDHYENKEEILNILKELSNTLE